MTKIKLLEKFITNGQIEEANILINKDQDPTKMLLKACNKNSIIIVTYYITNKLSLNLPDYYDEEDNDVDNTPFMEACIYGHLDLVKLMRPHINIDELSPIESCTAFISACASGRLEVAQYLLNEGANIHLKTYDRNALNYAADETIIDFLLMTDIDINNVGPEGTPLMDAGRNNKPNIVKKLIDAKCDLNIQTKQGLTALMIVACESGSEEIVKLLINSGADMNLKCDNLMHPTALFIAIQNKNYNLIQLFMDSGVDLTTQNNDGDTILLYCCRYLNNLKVVERLLGYKNQFNLNSTNKEKYTALSVACGRDYYDLVILLISYGADVNLDVYLWESPLSLALNANATDIVKLLIERGVKVDKSLLVLAKGQCKELLTNVE